jgi:hypothetical protein
MYYAINFKPTKITRTLPLNIKYEGGTQTYLLFYLGSDSGPIRTDAF